MLIVNALLKLLTPAQVVQLIYLSYYFAFTPYLGNFEALSIRIGSQHCKEAVPIQRLVRSI